jgi:hypothetical protein
LSIEINNDNPHELTITGQVHELWSLRSEPKTILLPGGLLSIKLVQQGTDYVLELSLNGKVETLHFNRVTTIDGVTITHRSRPPRTRTEYEISRVPR